MAKTIINDCSEDSCKDDIKLEDQKQAMNKHRIELFQSQEMNHVQWRYTTNILSPKRSNQNLKLNFEKNQVKDEKL